MEDDRTPQVLLLHPRAAPPAPPYALMPMGALDLVARLRTRRIDAEAVNLALEHELDPSFHLDALLRGGRPDVVLIPLHWYEHAHAATEVAAWCKEAAPRVPVVMGGITATAFAEEILDSQRQVDFVIRGDAEGPLLDLVPRLLDGGRWGDVANLTYRRSGAVYSNPQTYVHADLNDAEPTAGLRALRHWEAYLHTDLDGLHRELLASTWVPIGRGCPHECPWCGGSGAAHERLFGRETCSWVTPERLCAWIEELVSLGVEQIKVSHDLSQCGAATWNRLRALRDGSSRNVGVYNECWQLPTPRWIKEFAETFMPLHSRLVLTPLVGDEAVRARMGRRFSNDALVEAIRAAISRLIPCDVFFSSNTPGETASTFEETLRLAKRISQAGSAGMIRMFNQPLTVDPSSDLSMRPAAYGLELQLRAFSDYVEYSRDRGEGRQSGFVSSDPEGLLGMEASRRWSEAVRGFSH